MYYYCTSMLPRYLGHRDARKAWLHMCCYAALMCSLAQTPNCGSSLLLCVSMPCSPLQSQKLVYLDAVIKETLRVHSSTLLKMTANIDTAVAGIFLPAGTDVYLLMKPCTTSEANFTRATDFWPERWLIGAGLEPKPDEEFVHNSKAHFPFGGGGRYALTTVVRARTARSMPRSVLCQQSQ